MNIYAGLFTLYVGLSISTSIFVGNAIGQFNIPLGRLYTKISMLTILALSIILASILFGLRTTITSFYTSEGDI